MDVFSHNGQVKPSAEASISLFSIEFTYGFGAYENIRVIRGDALYADEHAERLLASATTIELEHQLDVQKVQDHVTSLISKIDEESYNLKLLLIGGRTAAEAQLYILPLRPKFPDRKLYKTGTRAITFGYERYLPNAKTLNMLPSYMAYKKAQAVDAYDAILVNQRGEMTEGTRTNLFAIKNRTLLTPPAHDILVGVTRTHVIETATAIGMDVVEKPLALDDMESYDSYFLTSTSSKIMPLCEINNTKFEISDAVRTLMKEFSK